MAAADTSILRFAELIMNIDTHGGVARRAVHRPDRDRVQPLALPARERRRVISKSELLDNVWGYDFHGDPNIVETYISIPAQERSTIREPALIHTIRRVGYTLRLPRDG